MNVHPKLYSCTDPRGPGGHPRGSNTYPGTEFKMIKYIEKLIFDEVNEEKLFGKHKYEPEQTSVMITYQP